MSSPITHLWKNHDTRKIRILAATIVLLILTVGILELWPLKLPRMSVRREVIVPSQTIRTVFAGYTNNSESKTSAIIEIRNQGKEAVWLDGILRVHFHDQNLLEHYDFGQGGSILGPGTTQQVRFPAPRDGLSWKAEVAEVELKEINRKQHVRKLMPDWHWLRRLTFEYFVSRPRYAETEWIIPLSHTNVKSSPD